MWETKLFIDGKRASLRKAQRRWLTSQTYKMANPRTRDQILKIALVGDENGNHNPSGEIEHLAEAGITLGA